MDKMREQFEAIATRRDMSVARLTSGQYKSSYTRAAWDFYQAATQAALEQAIAACMECDGALNNAGACAVKIRALIGKKS